MLRRVDAPPARDDAALAPSAEPPTGLSPAVGHRQTVDRRQRPTPLLSKYLLVGRRRGGRRLGETDRVYVDRPGAWLIVAFAALVGLSVLDAALTLDVLSKGGGEANPVMSAALRLGDTGFVVVKTIVTIVGAAFLCLHKNWRLGRACLWVALLGYGGVTAWHLHLQHLLGW
jgi:hypothetical protein